MNKLSKNRKRERSVVARKRWRQNVRSIFKRIFLCINGNVNECVRAIECENSTIAINATFSQLVVCKKNTVHFRMKRRFSVIHMISPIDRTNAYVHVFVPSSNEMN